MTTLETADPVGLVRKVFEPVEVNFTPGERSMIAWITTDSVDHEGDVVLASGVDFKSVFLGTAPNGEDGNPCVLAFHDYGRWPLGKCDWIKAKRSASFNGLYAKTVFDEDPGSEVVWLKIKSRTLRGISIGFKPPVDLKSGEWGPPTREELAKRPDWKNARRVIRRCVLLEYSVCSLGMNPQALVVAVNKGVYQPIYSTPEANPMPDAAAAQSGVETKTADPVVTKDGDTDGGDETMSFKPGDHVAFTKSMKSGHTCGEVKSVHTDGTHDGDSDDEEEGEVTATPENPVAKVKCHTKGADGKCMAGATVKTLPCADITPWDEEGTSGGSGSKTGEPPEVKAVVSLPPDNDDGPGTTNDNTSSGSPPVPVSLKRGDAVKINGEGHKGYGKVMSVHRDGDFVPDVEQHVLGSPDGQGDGPAARVHRYKALNGGFVKTGVYTGHSCKSLTKLDGGLAEPATGKSAGATDDRCKCPAPASKTTSVTEELPPLAGGRTDADRLKSAALNLAKTVSADGITAIVAAELDRRAGFVN